jgi:hypothetical protein
VYDHVSPQAPYWMGALILAFACLVLVRVKVKAGMSRPAAAYSAAD